MIEDTGTYADGEFVAQHVDQDTTPKQELLVGGVAESRVQPNGVDVGIDTIDYTVGEAKFRDGEYSKPMRSRVKPVDGDYVLEHGSYIITYDVTVDIPAGYVGRMYPRSRVMRSGLHLTSALWDQGYYGKGEGLLQIPIGIDSIIHEEETLAQFCLIEADKEERYSGTHQGEGVKTFSP
jgi:dUTP pyrophosphatase